MNYVLPSLLKTPIHLFLASLLTLLLQHNAVSAQTHSQPFAFNPLTINDGLSQGMVTCILQDRYGFMWFATLDGLNRYDGYHFIVYRHDAQDASSVTESFAKSLFEDSRGRLWIGTVSGGLDLFDRKTETFIHLKYQEGNTNSLSQGAVNSISEDQHGNIWVDVSGKLDKISPYKKQNVLHEEFLIEHVKAPANAAFSLLSITKSNQILYANAKNGVIYKLDDKKKNWSVALNLNDYMQPQSIQSRYRIIQLLEDKLKKKLYVLHEGGVIRLDEKTGSPEKIYRNEFFKNYVTPLQVSLDHNGFIWFSGVDHLTFFNTHTGQLSYAEARDPSLTRPLKHTYTTFIDRSGLLWIGTSGYGILKRNPRSEIFHHTGKSSDYSIKEADNGTILIGNNILVKQIFDKATGQLTAAPPSGKNSTNTKYFNKYLFPPVASDRSGAWFAEGNGLRYHNENAKTDYYYPLPVTSSNEYADLIQCEIKDLSGNIWLGTTEGLLRFGIADMAWTLYKNKLYDSSSLSSNVIFSLCLDPFQPKKYLWIGTGGGGLNRMNMLTGECIFYSIKDGLPNNVIYGILNDDDGNLWMSTNKGLSCFNIGKRTFKNFDYNDGLQSNEFNRGAYCRTKDGCLFFGGVNGFNYFYPRDILNNKAVPQIVITGLNIRNQPVLVQSEGSPLTTAIYLTKKLTLPYTNNLVSFEFASMDFTDPEKNLYQYKLQGFEKEWINSDDTHSATYTNLDPGTYTFRVKGSNNDGTWNEEGTSIQLTILPPWYMTWWFRTLLILTISSVVYGFHRYGLVQTLKLQAMRNRIADDLHDEVGSNLSNILIFSTVAQQKLTVQETAPLLQKITHYSQHSMEAMNDIVWMINTKNDRFENIMIKMHTLAAELSETTGCRLYLNFDEALNNIRLNMEGRKNFYLIYKEALNNIAKYAGSKSVWIEAKWEQNSVSLKIADDGQGFDMANTSWGNGLLNMKKRTQILNGTFTVVSAPGAGTTLKLKFKTQAFKV